MFLAGCVVLGHVQGLIFMIDLSLLKFIDGCRPF
jgi:hypothetical protein